MAAPRPPVLLGRASEREALDRLLENVRGGQSAVLVIRGEAGVGKTALLHYCARQASGFRVARIAGVESEMELPFAGLHQLCAPMLDRLDALPEPQQARPGRRARAVVRRRPRPLPGRPGRAQPAGRGRRGAAAAVLRRRRAVARCRLGPGPRLRRATAAGGVGGDRLRRARADRRARAGRPAGAARSEGSPRRTRAPCSRPSSRAGSTSASATGSSPRRAAIRWRCWSCRAALTATQLAGRVRAAGRACRCRGGSRRASCGGSRRCPRTTRLLLLVAAAEPVGDPPAGVARGRAARDRASAADGRRDGGAAGDRRAGDASVIRWCARRSTDRHRLQERRAVHLALAEATDRGRRSGPPRVASGRGRGGPDEEVAVGARALGRPGAGARRPRRGGCVPAACGRADRRPGPPGGAGAGRRRRRACRPARSTSRVGCWPPRRPGPLDELAARPRWTCCAPRSPIAESRGSEAPRAAAAGREDARAARRRTRARDLSRRVERGAVRRASGAAPAACTDVSRAALARATTGRTRSVRPICCCDGLRAGVHRRTRRGGAASSSGRRAASPARSVAVEEVLRWGWLATAAAVMVWDYETCLAVAARGVELARDVGRAGRRSPSASTCSPRPWRWAASSRSAASLIAEADAVTEATGARVAPVRRPRARRPSGPRGRGRRADRRHDRARPTAGGQGTAVQYARWARAVLLNGLGRYEEALAAAQDASDDTPELFVSAWALSELVEAAARSEDTARARGALERLAEATRSRAKPTGGSGSRRARARC